MKKLSYKYIKEQIENRGYKLISTEYKGYYNKLEVVCDKGHKYKTNWNVLRVGSGCPVCYRNRQSSSMLKNFDEIKSFVENEGFKLISTKKDYNGNYSKLKSICPEGHKLYITWSDFKRGVRCSECSGTKKKTIEEVKQIVAKFGYKCLSKEYINWKSKLIFQCPLGHIYETTWAIFQQGGRCPECNKIDLSIRQSGPNCNFWRGGISTEPYCYEWTDDLKEMIKYRDGYKCLNPCCTSGELLSIHHIDYNKKNCSLENLITTCRSCNSKANKDRKWHKSWYQTILNKRYGYKYEVK